MSQRIHPGGETSDPPEKPPSQSKAPAKSKPPPRTVVVKIPKNQVYRVPPPENAELFVSYSSLGSRRRRSCCCCSLIWIAAILLLLLLAGAAVIAALYFVLRPTLPKYSVDRLSVKSFNLTSDLTVSPVFDVTVRAENPNREIGIHYVDGSSVSVSYSDVTLCNGVWPSFYQGTRNITVFKTALTGSGVRLSGAMQLALGAEQRRGEVPMEVNVKVPVRVMLGSVKSWTVTVKVQCEVKVDKLTADSRIVSKTCGVEMDF